MSRDLDRAYAYIDRRLDASLAQKEREIKAAYRSSLRRIQDELALMYRKYEIDGALTYAEMTRYNRLAGLEKEIGAILGENDRTVRRTLKRLTADQYEQAYFGHAWAIEQNVGVALKWGMLKDDEIRAVVDNALSLIARDSLTAAERTGVRRALTQGLIRGESYGDMTRGIREALDRSYKDALRIARTEAHRAQIEGTITVYDKAENIGIEGQWIWVASLDDRTRETHRSLDGEAAEIVDSEHVWKIDGMQTRGPGLFGRPEQDINCRCAIRYEITGLEPKLRRTREGGIEPYQTYAEWERRRK